MLGWDHDSIYAGTMTDGGLDLAVWRSRFGLTDIRNCSWAPCTQNVVASGVDPQAWRYQLRSLRYPTGGESVLMSAGYILHNAVDPAGERVAFTAGPSPLRDDVSLYVYEVRTGEVRHLIEGSISRGCIPSWWTVGNRILASTTDHQVVAIEPDLGRLEHVIAGDDPACAPDGDLVAFVSNGSVVLAELGRPTSVTTTLWRPSALDGSALRAISWSADGQLLLATLSAGIAGKELRFARIEVRTLTVTMIFREGLRGMIFR
jgi:hypothetical protein